MLLLSPDAHTLVDSWKFWSFLISTSMTFVIGGYKTYQWIKDIRVKDLAEVKTGIQTLTASIDTVAQKLDETSASQIRSTEFQTQSVVRELAELRGLLYGVFHTPPMTHPVMAPARKKATTSRKKKPPVVAELTLDN